MEIELITIDSSMEKQLKSLFSHAYWTEKRKSEDIKKMIQNTSLIIGVVDKKTNELLGVARILTDFVYIAVVTDVIIHSEYRKLGLGKILMDAVVYNEQLKHVHQLELYCKNELTDFYHKWGFECQTDYLHFMRKYNKKDF